ncbi:MAG: MarR family transcriptional regulator [Burkholderiaceae bacterium]|jgi:DNA-binding MarR family transcriptional regulator|nr:MarR family transcriptional regulator [Burkholderiaceae bacterium]
MRKQVDKVNQSDAVLPNEVFETIHDIMHLYRARQYRALRDGGHDLTHMDAKVLGFFARRPGATQSDLAAHSGRDKAQLARLIRGLRDKGLLEARLDEEDRRSTRLQVTAEGMAVFGHLHAQGAQLSGVAMADLKHGEREQLISLLRRVHERLQSAPDE